MAFNACFTILFLLAAGFAAALPCADAEKALQACLANPAPSAEERAAAERIIARSQTIHLFLLRAEPFASAEEEGKDKVLYDGLRASEKTPVSHHTGTLREDGSTPVPASAPGTPGPGPVTPQALRGMELWFSTLAPPEKRLDKSGWFDEMRKPLQAGYGLKRLSVDFQADAEQMKRLARLNRELLDALTGKIIALKSAHPVLESFDAARAVRIPPPAVTGLDAFPSLQFRQQVEIDTKNEPRTKGPNEMKGPAWCKLYLRFQPLADGREQMMPTGQRFPLLGLRVAWSISSADPELDRQVDAIIRELLAPIAKMNQEIAESEV